MIRFTHKVMLIGCLLIAQYGCGGEPAATKEPGATQDTQPATAQPVAADNTPAPAKKSQPKPSLDRSRFDVVGLSLGMPMQEAEGVLKNYSDGLDVKLSEGDVGEIHRARVRGIKFPDFYLRGTTTVVYDAMGARDFSQTNETFVIVGSPIPNEPNISAIGREVVLPKEMLLSDLRAALVEKYGEPLFEADQVGNRHGMLSWSLTPDGDAQTDGQVVKSCTQGAGRFRLEVVSRIATLVDEDPLHYDRCGFTFIVLHLAGKGPEFVQTYATVFYDFPGIMKNNAKTIAFTQVEADKLEAAERGEAAKVAKPAL